MYVPVPGTIVYVWFLGVFKHKGIVSDRWWNGKPMVIANSRKTGVAEIDWEAFTSGNECFIERSPTQQEQAVVLYNARSLVGQPYDLANSNCEHFVYGCYGEEAKSPQFIAVVLLAILGGLALAANS